MLATPPLVGDIGSPVVKPAEFGVYIPFGLDKIVWDGETSMGAGGGLEVNEGVFDGLEEEANEADWSLDASTGNVPGGRDPLPV